MNHIRTIEIKNFKSIRHQKIEDCRRINVFIGYPNTGKSNILEALGLYSLDGIRVNILDILRVENFMTLYFNGDISSKCEITINTDYRCVINYANKQIKISQEFDRKKYSFTEIDNAGFLSDKRADTISTYGITEDFQMADFSGQGTFGKESLSPILKYEYRKGMRYASENSLHLQHPFGENIFEIISGNKELRDEIIEIFSKYNLKFSFDKTTQSFKILKFVGNDIFLIPYSMIANTLQRVIFYKTAIKSNEESVLLFEGPESHMFPPYISKFTNDIIFDKNNNQYFIATHSPYVLSDFMEDSQDDLSVYNCRLSKRRNSNTCDEQGRSS